MVRNSIKLDDGYEREHFLTGILILYVNFETGYI